MTTTEQAEQASHDLRHGRIDELTMLNGADAIDALLAENTKLRDALKNLLEDTQHAEHEDCEDGPCPVREARAALGEKS